MRIALISGIGYENPTARALFDGLGAAYAALGHSVRAVALHPAGRRTGAGSRPRCARGVAAPWGRLRCLPAANRDELDGELRGADLAHFHHFFSHVDARLLAVWRACRAAGIRPGVTFQDYGNPSAPVPPGRDRALLEAFLAEARWVTTLSRFCARRMRRDMPSLRAPVRVVPDGFDPAEAAPSRATAADPSVLCVARLAPFKGIDNLLRAWSLVCRRVPEAPALRICGPDQMRPRGSLQRLARRLGVAERVQFLGQVPRSAVWRHVHGSVFAVSSSRHEAFGMSVVEAMAAGKPVVATRSGGPEEIVRHGVSGLLARAGEPRALAEAMIGLLKDPRRRARLGRGAASRARRYRWTAVAEEYLALA